MMDPKGPIAWMVVTVVSTTFIPAPKRIPQGRRAYSGEPFSSFRELDAKLTLLANQQDGLKAAFNPLQAGSRSVAARRTTSSRRMNSTATGIWRIAGRLEGRYRKRHHPLGAHLF